MMELQHKSARRTVLVAAMVTLLAPLAPVAAQADTTQGRACRTVALPVPAGTFSDVTGGDPTGRYLVGLVTYPDVPRRAGALWRDGRLTVIDDSSVPGVQVDYDDVNRRGVVVGERVTDYMSFHTDAFTYRRGTFTFLPPLRAGESTEAIGINTRGDVVGNSGSTPIVWPADQPGTVRALTLPDGQPARGRATGIDEDGSVVGLLAPYPPGTPYLWPADGAPRPLPLPEGGVGGNTAGIQGGMVVGHAFLPGATVVTLWNLRDGGFKVYPDVPGPAFSVNRRGTLGVRGALVHADGRVVPVGDDAQVHTVADTGAAAGSTAFFDGQAVRWVGC